MPAANVLTVRALNRATLARQMLLARASTTVVDGIARLAGMQAQLARPPFIGLWTRLAGFDRRQLIDDLLARRVVRATAMRGTLHLMTAQDYLACRAALQPGLDRGLSWIAKRLTDNDRRELQPAGLEFFAEPAPFDDLRRFLATRFPSSDARALAYAIRLTVPLVQVPTDREAWGFPGAAPFIRADRWLKKKIPHPRDGAIALMRRYLAAFGPATIADARVWSYLPNPKAAFDALRPELVTFRDERKRELFDLPSAPRPDEETPVPVRFLPEYDNLLLAHDDRSRVIATEHRARVSTNNLQLLATFLVDGRVAGTWKIERKAKTAVLVVEPFGRVTRQIRSEIEAEGAALLRFHEPDAQMTPGVILRKT